MISTDIIVAIIVIVLIMTTTTTIIFTAIMIFVLIIRYSVVGLLEIMDDLILFCKFEL